MRERSTARRSGTARVARTARERRPVERPAPGRLWSWLARRTDHVAEVPASRDLRADYFGLPSQTIQRQARDDNGVAARADEAVSNARSSGGQALPATLRGKFESSLGADLSSVRVHTGRESAAAASAVGANAYTLGDDIHFAAGQYRPDDARGQHLLAHEVAHTVQQGGAGAGSAQLKLEVSTPGDASEREADRAADQMMAGRPSSLSATAGGMIQRDSKKEGVSDAAPQSKPSDDTASNDDLCQSKGMANAAQRAACADEVAVYRAVIKKLQQQHADKSRSDDEIDESLQRVLSRLGDYLRYRDRNYAFADSEEPDKAKERCETAVNAVKELKGRLRSGHPDATNPTGQAWKDANNTLRNAQGDLAQLICFSKHSAKQLSSPCDFIVYQSDDKTLSSTWKTLATLYPGKAAVPFGATTEEGFNGVIERAKKDGCSCVSSIEFWGHGSPGRAFSNRMRASDFDIPGLDSHGPDVDADRRSEWLASLEGEQQAYVKLRELMCRPGGSVYYRTCEMFAGKRGVEFAEKAVRFWQVPVTGHTKDIGVSQPGKYTLGLCQKAYWAVDDP